MKSDVAQSFRPAQKEANIKLARGDLLDAYRVLKTIREYEERVYVEFAAGEIPGFVQLYVGEESCAHLSKEDDIPGTWPLHRQGS